MGHVSSFFIAFFSTRSRVSRNDGGNPLFADSAPRRGSRPACSAGRKFMRSERGTFESESCE